MVGFKDLFAALLLGLGYLRLIVEVPLRIFEDLTTDLFGNSNSTRPCRTSVLRLSLRRKTWTWVHGTQLLWHRLPSSILIKQHIQHSMRHKLARLHHFISLVHSRLLRLHERLSRMEHAKSSAEMCGSYLVRRLLWTRRRSRWKWLCLAMEYGY